MPLKPYKQQDVSTSLDMTQCSFQPFASNAGSVPRNGRNLRHKVVIVRADELRLHQYLHLQPTKFVQPMTYFDQIADAIYDGSINIPVPSIRLGLRKMGLSFPLMVLAAQPQYTKRVMKGLHHQKYFWHLHQGLVYVLWQESDVSKANYSARDWLCGEPQFCAKPEKFIHCLQNAILSFRSQEVKAIIHQNPLAVSFAAEMDTRRLALSRIQESITSKSTFEAESWQNALEVWIEIVVVRHQSHLNTLHRKFAEFFSLLTCDVDDSRSLANCFSRIQRDLHKMYSLTELRATVPLMVAEFRCTELGNGRTYHPFLIKLWNGSKRISHRPFLWLNAPHRFLSAQRICVVFCRKKPDYRRCSIYKLNVSPMQKYFYRKTV